MRLIKALFEKYYPYRSSGGVLDAYGGTGTTSLVALDCSLSCIYVDADESNFTAATHRFERFMLDRIKHINSSDSREMIDGSLLDLTDSLNVAADPMPFLRVQPRKVVMSTALAK